MLQAQALSDSIIGRVDAMEIVFGCSVTDGRLEAALKCRDKVRIGTALPPESFGTLDLGMRWQDLRKTCEVSDSRHVGSSYWRSSKFLQTDGSHASTSCS